MKYVSFDGKLDGEGESQNKAGYVPFDGELDEEISPSNTGSGFKKKSAMSRIAKGLGLSGGDYDESSMGGQMITPAEAAQNSKEYAKQEQAEFDKKYAQRVREQALKVRGFAPEDAAAIGDSVSLSEDELKAASKRLGYEGMNRNVQQIAGDLALSGVAGVKQLAKAGVDLVSPEGETAQYLNESIAETNSRMSPEMREQLEWYRQQIKDAESQGRGAEFVEAFGNLSPQLTAHYAANTLPSMAPVFAAGKVAQGLATARGATAAGTALAGARAGGVANAALNAGGARGDAFEELKQTYISKGATEDQAIELALSDSWLPAGVGAVTGYIGGRFGAESDIIRDSVTTAAKFGLLPALKAVLGSLGRELTTEQAEEILPKITTNLLAEKEPLDGIAEISAQTVAGSVGMGSVGAASAGRAAYQNPLERELQGFADAVDGTNFNPVGATEEARRAAAGVQPLSLSDMAELQARSNQPPAPSPDPSQDVAADEDGEVISAGQPDIAGQPPQADIDQDELLNQINALTQPPEIEQQPNSPLTNAANQAQGVQQAAELAQIRQELINAVTGDQNASESEQVAQEAAQAGNAQAGPEQTAAPAGEVSHAAPSQSVESQIYDHAFGQVEALINNLRQGFIAGANEYDQKGTDTTNRKVRKHAIEQFTRITGDKDTATRIADYLLEDGAIASEIEWLNNGDIDAAISTLAKRYGDAAKSIPNGDGVTSAPSPVPQQIAPGPVSKPISERETPQLIQLAKHGLPGKKEEAVAELARRGVTLEPPAQQDEAKPEAARPVQGSSTVSSNLSPIQRRDDLVGAIMRVTGGNGIAANMAQTIVGDTANNATKVRGLFTNAGTMDLDDTADLLRNEEGYDVRDGNHLAELIREQAAGNPVYSSARIEREAAKDADRKHREEVLRRAKKYGVRHVARPFAETEAEVFRIMEERHVKAVQLLDDRSFTRFSAMLDAAQRVVSYEDLDAIVTDAHNRFEGRKVWDEARKQIRAHIDDLVQAEKLKRQESQNAIEIEGQPDNEPDWISDGQPIEGLGGGSAIDRINEAGEGQATPEGSGGSQEEFSLAQQTEEEVRAQEEARKESEAKAQKEEARLKREKEDADTQAEIRRRSEAAADTFRLGQDGMDNLSGQGGLFDAQPAPRQPEASQPPKDQGAAAFKSGAERSAPEGLSIADKARWLGGYDDAKAAAAKAPTATEKRETLDESLRAGSISADDYMKTTGLTDEDVGFLSANSLRDQADRIARERSPYHQAINKVHSALSDQMQKAMDSARSTPQQRKSREERMARITRDRETLDMLARKYEHPFRNDFVSKLTDGLHARFTPAFDKIKTGQQARDEFYKDSYGAWAELLIEAANKKEGANPAKAAADQEPTKNEAAVGAQSAGQNQAQGDLIGASKDTLDSVAATIEQKRRQLVALEDQMIGEAGLAPGFLEEALRSRKVPRSMKDSRNALRAELADLRKQYAALSEQQNPKQDEKPNTAPSAVDAENEAETVAKQEELQARIEAAEQHGDYPASSEAAVQLARKIIGNKFEATHRETNAFLAAAREAGIPHETTYWGSGPYKTSAIDYVADENLKSAKTADIEKRIAKIEAGIANSIARDVNRFNNQGTLGGSGAAGRQRDRARNSEARQIDDNVADRLRGELAARKIKERIQAAEQQTNHDATPAQKEAGNYAKGKFTWNGLTVSVETAKGEDRTDKETNGDKWRVTMPATYGYILGTKGADKDHVDLFMGDNPESESVFVVNQNQVDSQKFDEHKVMAGFASAKDAQAAYMASFEDGFGDRVFGSITGPYSIKEFREMLDAGKFEKPQSIGSPISPLSMIDVQLDGETMSAEQAIKDIDDQLSLADKLLNCVTK